MSKKFVLPVFCLLIFSNIFATNYYLSSSSGSDSNNGKTPETPWKSIGKLETVLGTLLPGDSVFFKCNDTFSGQLILSQSGNSAKNIYFGSYGSGKKPVISGTTPVTNWAQTSANIWEATCAEAGSTVTSFFINDIPQQIGRWPNVTEPNKGYLKYESHSGTNQITDNELSDTINWSGAEALVRNVPWNLEHMTIKSHIANTLLFTTNVYSEFLDGFGYFIQNDPRTLDQQGEWYYNQASKKFSLYSVTDPNTFITKTTQQDNLIKMSGISYITVENLRFDGSGRLAMDISNCSKITIRNNEFDHSGDNAVGINGTNNALIESNQINHTSNNALGPSNWPYDCKNIVIRNNVIKNTALVAGMGLGINLAAGGIYLFGTNFLVEQNTIDSVGHMGILFYGDTITIKNNVVSNYSMTQDDGGGIYTWSDGTRKNYSRTVIGNIVFNGIGAPEGKGWPTLEADGIYIDDRNANVDVIGNTIFNCSNYGIHIHNANHVNIRRNTVFDNGTQFRMGHDYVAPTFPITNCVVDSNLFVSKKVGQLIASFATIDNGISDLGMFDYNSYCRPLDDKLTIQTDYVNGSSFHEALTLEDWQSKYMKDQRSGKSPIAIEPYKILGVISSNFITNSSFEGSTIGWYPWANYNNGTIALAKGEGDPGDAMKTSFTSTSGKTDAYMIAISNSFKFAEGKSYRIKFSAKCSNPDVSINLIPRKNAPPHNNVAETKSFVLGTSYNHYEFLLNATMTDTNSRIDFEILEGKGDVWFDNIELVEVEVERTNPDDYILFELNKTNIPKTIDIPTGFIDVKGNPVSGAVTLQPFSSVVLFRKLFTSAQVLPKFSDSNVRLYPNPASNFVTLKSTFKITSVNLFDINGRLIRKYTNTGSAEFTINGLPHPGLYIIQVQTGAGTEFKKLLVQN